MLFILIENATQECDRSDNLLCKGNCTGDNPLHTTTSTIQIRVYNRHGTAATIYTNASPTERSLKYGASGGDRGALRGDGENLRGRGVQGQHRRHHGTGKCAGQRQGQPEGREVLQLHLHPLRETAPGRLALHGKGNWFDKWHCGELVEEFSSFYLGWIFDRANH